MDKNYSLINVNEHDKFITNYKAVYQAMTAKHDCKSKIFPRQVKVNLQDIFDLNDRVTEKLKNYNDAGFSISVMVSFDGRQTIEFSTWYEFENHKWNEGNAINSITIIWEFNALLPKYEVPQKHVLMVKITDGLKPQEMLNIVFAGKLENMEDIDKQMYPVVARVDFINYVLGDELLHIVQEWDNSLTLQREEDSKILYCVRKHKRKLAFILNYITKCVLLICSINIIKYILMGFRINSIGELTIENICDVIWVVGVLLIFSTIINKISEWLSNVFYRTMDMEQEQHIFYINKGDTAIQEKLQNMSKKNYIYTIGSVVGTFLINLICSFICGNIIK